MRSITQIKQTQLAMAAEKNTVEIFTQLPAYGKALYIQKYWRDFFDELDEYKNVIV